MEFEDVTEEWALETQSGYDLDRVCAIWREQHCPDTPRPYSSEWAEAGRLLEEISEAIASSELKIKDLFISLIESRIKQTPQITDLRPIDIARACATLSAKGITRAEKYKQM